MKKFFTYARRVFTRTLELIKRVWHNRPNNNVEKILFDAFYQINGELKKGIA
jgi:hypothetical protein